LNIVQRLKDILIEKPFIIAEIGVNHECSIDRALRLIDLAAEGGADAAKFQTYKAKDLARKDSPAYWDLSKEKTTSQRELFEKFDCFLLEDYERLYEHCLKRNIEFMSTPFSGDAFDWINPLVKRHKLSSSDLTNVELIEKIKSSKKPVIASTGAANIKEIRELVRTFSCVNDFTLLHCILSYPTDLGDANLSNITYMKEQFPDIKIGYSDHLTSDYIHALFSAYIMGASVIETHFTDNKEGLGNDHYHALDVYDLKKLVSWCDDFQKAYGTPRSNVYECEKQSRLQARRSVTSKVKIRSGELLTKENITLKRPGDGIPAIKYYDLLGKKALHDIEEDKKIPDDWLI